MNQQGDSMSREELAAELRRVMKDHDLSFKEVAGKAQRSITTVQRARNGEKLSERTFARIQSVVSAF